MAQSSRKIQSKTSPKLLIILIVLAAAFFLIKFFVLDNKKTPKNNQYGWEQKLQPIEDPQNTQFQTISGQETEIPPDQNSTDQFTQETMPPCQQKAEKLTNFFNHLSQQEYTTAYELTVPVDEHINSITQKLLKNPPIILRETDDLFTVLKNTAHFYRILGHKDLYFIKDILTYEHDNIEHLMELFYQLSLSENDCEQNSIKLQADLKRVYEYTSFFLNTLGGQSYLFRRDSRLRILTRYYCMLILDRAAKQKINRYNIDVNYTLETVLEDIQDADSLEYQEQYLTKLKELKNELQARKNIP